MTDDERLTELEIRLAYLEDGLASLDAIVSRQASSIDELHKLRDGLLERVRELQERLDEITPTSGEPPPPHY